MGLECHVRSRANGFCRPLRCRARHWPRVVAMPSSGQVDVPVFNFCRIDLDPQAPIDNVVPIPRICGQSQSRLMLCMKLIKRVLDTKVQRALVGE
jgi:hypothetical protein